MCLGKFNVAINVHELYSAKVRSMKPDVSIRQRNNVEFLLVIDGSARNWQVKAVYLSVYQCICTNILCI